jgi:predicted Zn-dependent peptidase
MARPATAQPLVLRGVFGLLAGLSLPSTGCGGGQSTVRGAPPLSTEAGVVRKRLHAGPELAVIRHPGAGLLQLGLFLDAGSRDADPPQVATLAAWLAAEAAQGELRPRVLPDGTEHLLTCRKAELAACLGRLARVLGARRIEPARFAAARARLVDARRRAAAADPGRSADALALGALYGEPGSGLLPFGRPEQDAGIEPSDVAGFLAAHYGPARVLLVVAGEVEPDAVADAVQAALAGAPPATEAREDSRPSPKAGGVAVEVSAERALSLALSAPDLEQAHAATHALRTRLARDGLATGLRGHVVSLRGGALALLRASARDPVAAVRAASHELARLRVEGAKPQPGQPPGAAMEELVRRLGARWMTQGETAAEPGLQLGIGVLVPGGRGDQPKSADPDRALRDRSLEALEGAFEQGLALAAPALQTERDARTATAALDNGARIELRAQPGDLVAVAVRFRPGAAADPPLWHGRAALLATLTSTACKGQSAVELQAELQALGARLSPRVDPESWGLLLQAPAASWQAALALALDCALHPQLGRAALATARARLLERHGGDEGALTLEAGLATRLESEAPGLLAPWGDPLRQASVELSALRELWSETAVGSAVSVSAVGPLELEPALGLLARRLAELPGATSPTKRSARPAPAPPKPQLDAAPPEQPTLVLAVWRAKSSGEDAAGALAFAALMRAALTGVAEARPIWHDAAVARGTAYAAVALSGPTEQLATLEPMLATLASATDPKQLERAVEHALALSLRTRSAAASSPAALADSLAALSPARPPPAPSRDAALALARALASAPAAWLPLR